MIPTLHNSIMLQLLRTYPDHINTPHQKKNICTHYGNLCADYAFSAYDGIANTTALDVGMKSQFSDHRKCPLTARMYIKRQLAPRGPICLFENGI